MLDIRKILLLGVALEHCGLSAALDDIDVADWEFPESQIDQSR